MTSEQGRERVIHERIQDLGTDTFPDDEVRWHVRGIRHHGSYSFVEADPAPATVGYPRFRFVVHFDARGGMQQVGCYCLDGGRWSLLCTTPGTPEDWRKIPVE